MAKKKKKVKKKPRGRPRCSFTKAQKLMAAELAFRGMKNNAIATLMGINKDTFIAYFGEIAEEHRALRKLVLLDSQTKKAVVEGDTTMLIFLGKNELEQADKKEYSGDFNISGLADLIRWAKSET